MSELAVGRFSRNLIANLAYFTLSLVIGVLYTPFVITRMGVEVYGLIPLANSVTNYLSVLTTGISAAVGRYVTMDYARGDQQSANGAFNTFFFTGATLTGLLALAGVFLVPLAPRWFQVPAGQEDAFVRLLAAILAALLIGMMATCFDAAIWVKQRFDLRSVIDTVSLAVRTGLVVFLFLWVGPRLDWVTLGIAAAALTMLAGNWLVWRRLTPELKISPRLFDWSRLPAIANTSRWLLLNQAGALLAMHVDLVLVNLFVGAEAGGLYAAVQQWSNLLRTVCLQVAIVLAPSFAAQHATEDRAAMLALSKRAVRLLGLVIALPVGLLAGLGQPLLVSWLGAKFGALVWLAVMILVPVAVEGSHLPLSPVLLAIDKIRWPSIVTVGIGVMNLGLGTYLARYLGWGMYGVAAGSAIATVFRYGLFYPIYTARVMGQRWTFYLVEILRALAATLGVTALGILVSKRLPMPSWLWLFAAGSLIALVYSALVWQWALDSAERKRLREMALKPFGRS
jgi:membrane protein EpsK